MLKVTPEQRKKIQEAARELGKKGSSSVGFDQEGYVPAIEVIAQVEGRRHTIHKNGETIVTRGSALILQSETGETTLIPARFGPHGEITVSVDDARKLGIPPKALRSALRRGRRKTVIKDN